MGLTYHYKFRASPDVNEDVLTGFLAEVEIYAKRLGFSKTLVLNAPFDTSERRQFARRFTSGLLVEDRRLIGRTPAENQRFGFHDSTRGACRLAPEHGVLLVVTDERGIEVVFGFLRYPRIIRDGSGNAIMPTPQPHEWSFSDFIKTADVRYRKIVRRFGEFGYLATESDDYSRLIGPPAWN